MGKQESTKNNAQVSFLPHILLAIYAAIYILNIYFNIIYFEPLFVTRH